ncbi:Bacitracin transport ATP-binding protein BcrA [Lentibacillus sp. JNUCC-1]|uniref:ABC transporter ATP-binding protein n=1 Tax=Lentibacillus sp. JNUCC-1 TaxID=2654513 RepID=UPI0013211DBA|nr:Bacitracin transport ATP-binding protein BcrA [Lentibacillus sp. JNUCC-1]
MNAIEFVNVTKKRPDFSVNGLNLSIPTEFVTGIIGQNGSGKTTTLHMLMDIIKPDHGQIQIFGQPHNDHSLKQKIGFVHDQLYMYQDFTIKKMKAFIAPLYETWNDNLFQHYLMLFELPYKKKLKTFSQGMKMKCGLLFALAHEPDLIIMDEPTSGLDPVFRRELLDLFQELMLETGKTIVLASHITSDLDRIADYIIFMHEGQVLLNRSMNDIDEFFHIVKGPADMVDADTKELFAGLEITDVGFTALYEGQPDTFEPYREEVIIEKASLEDIMYFLIKKPLKGGKSNAFTHQA